MLRKTLSRSHIGHIRNDLRELARTVLRKCDNAANNGESIHVFVDRGGEVYAARAFSGSTLTALRDYPSCLVGTYQTFGDNIGQGKGSSRRKVENPRPKPTVDGIASDIGQHENSIAVVREFLAEEAA